MLCTMMLLRFVMTAKNESQLIKGYCSRSVTPQEKQIQEAVHNKIKIISRSCLKNGGSCVLYIVYNSIEVFYIGK